MTDNQNTLRYWFGSFAMILAVTLLRYWFITSGQLNLAPDEAQYWDWSRSLQWSYYSKGPLIAVMNYFGSMLIGPTELGVRAGALVGSVLMQLTLLGWIGGMLGRVRTAFWTLLVMNTTFLFMAGSVLMTTDSPLLVCWIAAMVCLHAATEKESIFPFVLLGFLLALGITAKYTMLAFAPLAVLAGWWLGRRGGLPPKFWPRLWKTLLIGTVLGLLPILIWNATNDWEGIKHILQRGAMTGDKAKVFWNIHKFPEYFGSQFGVITPWWLVFMLAGGWKILSDVRRKPESPLVSERVGILLTVFFWPVWLFFLFWSLHTKIEANWSAAAYPAGFVMAGVAIEAFMQRPASRWQKIWPALAIFCFALFYAHGLIPYSGPYQILNLTLPSHPAKRLMGWQDMGLQVEALAEEELGGLEKTFVFGSEYGVAAELSFYVPDQRRAFCLSSSVNQYTIWPGPGAEFENAILVLKGDDQTPPQALSTLFATVDPPRVIQTQHHGKLGQTFTLYLCRGYKGQWLGPERNNQ